MTTKGKLASISTITSRGGAYLAEFPSNKEYEVDGIKIDE